LGLASLLGIVRSHKGGLHVTSIVGQGTTFTLLFPSVIAEEPRPSPQNRSSLLSIMGIEDHVLIIDDEDMVREGMADALTATGMQILTASDGPTGVHLFRKYQQKLKLVLLDLSMPGMSGEEIFHQLRTIDPHIPILLVSGYSEAKVMERFVSAGLTGFIQKPYTMESLLQQVQSHLAADIAT